MYSCRRADPLGGRLGGGGHVLGVEAPAPYCRAWAGVSQGCASVTGAVPLRAMMSWWS